MTADVPALPMVESGSKDLSETMLAVPFLIPSTRLLHMSSGGRNLSREMVPSFSAYSNPSERLDHSELASKSDRELIGESITKSLLFPSVLTHVRVSGTIDTGTALGPGHICNSSPS